MKFPIHDKAGDVLHSIEIDDAIPEAFRLNAAVSTALNSGKSLKRVRLDGADLNSIRCQNADFSEAAIKGCTFRCASMHNTNFEGAQILSSDFRHADLDHSNFQLARLIDCNFQGSWLTAANLNAMSLWDCTGNGREICSLQLPSWSVVLTQNMIQIGCQRHPVEYWRNFTDDDIRCMSVGAVSWWKEFRTLIFDAYEACGRTQWADEAAK